MGKRSRSKSKRAPKSSSTRINAAKKEEKDAGPANVGATSTAPPPNDDIDQDCVMYESPDEEKPVADNDAMESDSDESSTNEMELVAPDGNEADGNADSDVEVTFDFYDPLESDEPPIATFLSDLCSSVRPKADSEKAALNQRELSKTVCAQTRVGTVVKITDDSQPIGFITVLAIQEHRELLAPLAVCLRTAGAPESLLRSFNTLKEGEPIGSRVGLVLTGRVVNLPPQLTPKMFEALLCEVEWATEDEPTPEQRKSFDLHWFLYITDVYPAGTELSTEKKKKKPPKKKSRGKQPAAASATTEKDGAEQIAFTRMEDEILLNAATYTVTWKIPGEEAGPEGLIRRKMGMFIKKAKMNEAFEAIKRLFGVQDDEPEVEEELVEQNK